MVVRKKTQNGILLLMGDWKTLVISFVFLFLVMTQVQADILMFRHEGNGSGTLAGVQFGADFVITAFGDTDDRLVSPDLSTYWINHISASISIAGLGDFDILTRTRTFVNHDYSDVGFSRATVPGVAGLDLFNGPKNDSRFATWDMLGQIGPISGTGYLLQWDTNPMFFPLIETTGGTLKFISGSSYAIFTAVPEPASILLLGLGGLVLRKRRR